MRQLGVIDTCIAVLVGGIILYAFIRRWQTLGSKNFYFAMKVSMFVFAAFAIGFCLMEPALAIRATRSESFAKPALLVALVSVPCLVYYYGGPHFGWSWTMRMTVCAVAAFGALLIAVGPTDAMVRQYQGEDVHLAYFGAIIAGCGVAHAYLGSVLSAFNISMIINYFWKGVRVAPDLSVVFDVLADMGVRSSALQWAILGISTVLGLTEFLKQWLGDS